MRKTAPTDVPESEEKKKRVYVYNTVVHIENQHGHYTLTGLGVSSIISLLVAFLLHNELRVAICLVVFFATITKKCYRVLIYFSEKANLIKKPPSPKMRLSGFNF